MMWAFVVLACLELVVVHLLLWAWAPGLATFLSGVTLAGVIWLVTAIAGFVRLPVLLDDRRLVMRVGRLKSATIARADIAGVRTDWPAGTLKSRAVLNLALLAHPNVLVDLTTPLSVGGRVVKSIAHRLDDPGAFVEALQRLTAHHD